MVAAKPREEHMYGRRPAAPSSSRRLLPARTGIPLACKATMSDRRAKRSGGMQMNPHVLHSAAVPRQLVIPLRAGEARRGVSTREVVR
eukprot:scaffold349_cov352-Prasinococcus_capsulatus_cf.AAC.7